jgi:uncharacterized protein (DUF2164 family)
MISTTIENQLEGAVQEAQTNLHLSIINNQGQLQYINQGIHDDEEYINLHFNKIMEAILNEEENNIDINLNTDNNATNLTETNLSPLLNHFLGDKLIKKENDNLRIVFQIINGLHAPQTHKWIATINKILELGIDIAALVETCINWYKKRLNQKYKSALHNK